MTEPSASQEATTMYANLITYYAADQASREQLARRAERGWLTEQAVACHNAPSRLATLRWATGTLLVRIGVHLQGVGDFGPLASPDGARS